MTLTASSFFSLRADEVDNETESRFYGSLKMRNGTFKLTRASRFDQIEALFRDIISQNAKNVSNVLDVGVSTGITTIEFADFLKKMGSSPKLVATDLFINAYIVCPNKHLKVLTDQQGWPLQYDIYGVAVRSWIRRLDYFTLGVIPRKLAQAALKRRIANLIENNKGVPVRLISKRLTEYPEISCIQNDIFTMTPELVAKFDLIRAANILNKNYFSQTDLLAAVRNIKSYLKGNGSLLLVTRTGANQKNSGTLFRLDALTNFEIAARVGAGSEIEDLVLGKY
jgi:SAM-dependent methyltransferase